MVDQNQAECGKKENLGKGFCVLWSALVFILKYIGPFSTHITCLSNIQLNIIEYNLFHILDPS